MSWKTEKTWSPVKTETTVFKYGNPSKQKYKTCKKNEYGKNKEHNKDKKNGEEKVIPG